MGLVAMCLGCALCFWAPSAANAADIALPTLQAPPIKTYSTVLFGGVDDRTQSLYGYVGAVYALNGNIATDGFLFRTMGLYNPYNYSSAAVVGGNVDGRMTAFDVLIGYQKTFQDVTARLYTGLDFEGHRLSPDNPFDTNRGDAYGVHVRAELETAYASSSPFYESLLASYGSAKDRYWARGRVGYNFQGIIVGPEGVLTGNPQTRDDRVGAFVTFRNLAPVELSISAGFSQTNTNRGGGSAYGTLEVSAAF
jgi:hypothetical protein